MDGFTIGVLLAAAVCVAGVVLVAAHKLTTMHRSRTPNLDAVVRGTLTRRNPHYDPGDDW